MTRTFEYRLTVTIGDTNIEGNVYWTNFCSWFSRARELFLMNLLPADVNVFEFMVSRKFSIITCDISLKFVKPAFFTDKILVKINTANFGKCSVEILVEILNEKTGEVITKGKQKLAFVNIETKEIVQIPEELKSAALEYEIKDDV